METLPFRLIFRPAICCCSAFYLRTVQRIRLHLHERWLCTVWSFKWSSDVRSFHLNVKRKKVWLPLRCSECGYQQHWKYIARGSLFICSNFSFGRTNSYHLHRTIVLLNRFRHITEIRPRKKRISRTSGAPAADSHRWFGARSIDPHAVCSQISGSFALAACSHPNIQRT